MKAIDAAQPSSEAVEASTPSTVALRAGEAMAVDTAEQSMIAFGRSRKAFSKASPSLPSTVKVKAVEAKAERIVKSSNDVAVTAERHDEDGQDDTDRCRRTEQRRYRSNQQCAAVAAEHKDEGGRDGSDRSRRAE